MTIDYRAPPDELQISLLVRTLPDGRLWQAKYDRTRVLGRLAAAFASEIGRIYARIADLVLKELDPYQTRQLLLDWEESVGIPDACFDRSADLDERRRRVVQKLDNFGGIVTRAEIEDVLADFGLEVQLVPGSPANAERLGFPTPPYSTNQLKQIKHTVAVRVTSDADVFPLTFPIPFADEQAGLLRCLTRRIMPANIALQVFFNEDLSQPFVGAPQGVAPIAILDALSDTGADGNADPGSFTVSAGSDRLLVYIMTYKGGNDTISAAFYGGQPMAQRALVSTTAEFASHIRIFTLGEAGIAAASDSGFTVNGGTNGRYRALAGSFANVDQVNPIVDSRTFADNLNDGVLDLAAQVDGFAVAAAIFGNSASFDWTGVTERIAVEDDAILSYSSASGPTLGNAVTIDPDSSTTALRQAAAAITLRPAT